MPNLTALTISITGWLLVNIFFLISSNSSLEFVTPIFKNSIRKATTEARIALMTATTAEQKLSIMNSLKNARSEAVAARDAALAALGALPTPPAELKKDEKKRN